MQAKISLSRAIAKTFLIGKLVQFQRNIKDSIVFIFNFSFVPIALRDFILFKLFHCGRLRRSRPHIWICKFLEKSPNIGAFQYWQSEYKKSTSKSPNFGAFQFTRKSIY